MECKIVCHASIQAQHHRTATLISFQWTSHTILLNSVKDPWLVPLPHHVTSTLINCHHYPTWHYKNLSKISISTCWINRKKDREIRSSMPLKIQNFRQVCKSDTFVDSKAYKTTNIKHMKLNKMNRRQQVLLLSIFYQWIRAQANYNKFLPLSQHVQPRQYSMHWIYVSFRFLLSSWNSI